MTDNIIKSLINESIRETKNELKYDETRTLVESMVREELYEYLMEKRKRKKKKKKGKKKSKKKSGGTKASQVRDALKDPSINLSGLARKISGLSNNDDTRRSEISKIARGEWVPPTSIQNDILHAVSSSSKKR